MKKKKVVLSFLMAVLLPSLLYLTNQHNDVHSEWILSNIEALALGEDNQHYQCFGLGSLDCPLTTTKVYFVRNFNKNE